MADRVWWLDHTVPEDSSDPRSAFATSASNTFEVEIIAGLIDYLVKTNEYNRKDITVLTPYNAQLAALAQRLQGSCSLWLSPQDRESLIADGLLDYQQNLVEIKTEIGVTDFLKIATIDNFQGEESKIVILSTVRSNQGHHVGFLRTPNRINVACSRARDGFYIIGNSTTMNTVETWRQIIESFVSKAKIGPAFRAGCTKHIKSLYGFTEIQKPEQWNRIPVCKVPCGFERSCGHVCTLMCHAAILHERMGCSEPCAKYHSCGHQCSKICGEECSECEVPIDSFTLSCGHVAATTCGGKKDEICNTVIETILLACGHQLTRTCATQDQPLKCTEICSQILECGHLCQDRCLNCASLGHHKRCTAQCSKTLGCGHQCQSPCHTGPCPPCKEPCLDSCPHGQCEQYCGLECDPCVKPCQWTCVHQGGCATMCCLPCNTLPCSEPCTKLLRCGHLCPSLCGEKCTAICVQCQSGNFPSKAVVALPCGHAFEVHYLDQYFDTAKFYEISDTGRIERIGITSKNQMPNTQKGCPTCGEPCTGIKRYAIHGQLLQLKGNLDRMFKKLCRKMHSMLRDGYGTKTRLDQTFREYVRDIRSGPLAGRRNEEMTRNRGNRITEIQQTLVGFRGKVKLVFAKESLIDLF